MNSINPDLVFTVEYEDDFPEKILPTLDIYLWVVCGTILWSYYERGDRPLQQAAQELRLWVGASKGGGSLLTEGVQL